MTVANTTRKIRYTGNGATTVFSFPFKVFQSSDLKIYLIDSDGEATLKTISTHYTVSFASGTEGGTVTMLTAPTASEELLILRSLSQTQSTDFPTASNIPETSLENGLDKSVMLVQELQETLARSLTFSETSETSGITMPEPVAGYLLGWNASADNLENKSGAPSVTLPSASDKKGFKWDGSTVVNTTYDVDREKATVHSTTGSIGADTTIVLADSSGGNITLTLPDPTVYEKRLIIHHSVGGNKVTISKYDSDTVVLTGGETSDTIIMATQGDSVELVSDGTNWVALTRKIRVHAWGKVFNNPTIAASVQVAPNCNIEAEDTHGTFTNTTSFFEVPPGCSGRYEFWCDLRIDSDTATWAKNDYVQSRIRINATTPTTGGTVASVGLTQYPVNGASGTVTILVAVATYQYFLNEGDDVYFNIYQDSASTLEVQSAEIKFRRIGDV